MKRLSSLFMTVSFLFLLTLPMEAGIFDWFKKDKVDEDLTEITINLEQEPGTMDPQLLTDAVAIQANSFLMEGLTRLGKGGKVVPGVAKSWDVDGKVWTLHLRDDAMWSNGEKVTADDFYYGIKRAIDPETNSEYAYMTYYIENAEGFNNGDLTDFEKVGLKVIDDHTLEISLEKPAAYFASVLAFPTYYPLNKKFVEEKGMDFALEEDAILYNGPYVMTDWEHDSKMIFRKNENYWNKDAIKLDKVTALMIDDANTRLNMYKNGELDVVQLDGDQLPPYRDSEELVSYSDGSVWYFEYNTANELFGNRKIREGIARSIDRDEMVNKVLRNGSRAATGLVPYGFPGKDEGFRKDNGNDLFDYKDVEEAKRIFQEGLEEIGHTGPVEISLLTGTTDTATKLA
ncbi:MAG: peptide ABC transporter substrate-binding protein, partial [Fusobacteriota bacterium]